MGSSCSPSSVSALPGAGGLPSALLPAAAPAPPPLSGGCAAADAAVGVAAESSPAKSASQSCASAGAGAFVLPCPAAAAAVDDEVGAAAWPAVLPAADVPDRDPKSKLLSVPKTGPPAVWAESLLAWLGGGELSKTGLKSSRPEREMLAKSSSAEPSLASSRPSKSSSRSSKACLEDVVGPAVVEEPKMSSK